MMRTPADTHAMYFICAMVVLVALVALIDCAVYFISRRLKTVRRKNMAGRPFVICVRHKKNVGRSLRTSDTPSAENARKAFNQRVFY